MPVWLKKTLLGLLLLLLVLSGATYYQLKSRGILPRNVFETETPEIPDFQRPAVLLFNKANGYIHEEAIPAADTLIKQLAEGEGWDLYVSDSGGSHNPEALARFDLIVWNNVSGNVLTREQRESLKAWIADGGGWIGLHGTGGDRRRKWAWLFDVLVGAKFTGHTMNPQFQDADVLKADPMVLSEHLPQRWRIPQEEWYAFDRNPRATGSEIVLTIDEGSYITAGNVLTGNDRMEGEHPLAWRHQIGTGRVFYNSIGHTAATYSIPEYVELTRRAMGWAIRK